MTDARRLDVRDNFASLLLSLHEELNGGAPADVVKIMDAAHHLTHDASVGEVAGALEFLQQLGIVFDRNALVVAALAACQALDAGAPLATDLIAYVQAWVRDTPTNELRDLTGSFTHMAAQLSHAPDPNIRTAVAASVRNFIDALRIRYATLVTQA